ncbi:CBS domain-containing protein [Sphingopyxis alaskensis]|jgi:CBS-domain-containing membrane protein|uniref:CBS domain containing membrane protein n=1 Tax=Sphingopyxis alaskensis (strain DSM 13593 / LMG 18877 / RB2256) TaxID=317655 RepID=Q1GPM9_SPHAL|nr:CBS domain-containing protein [Sphingopyxis alaskensis]ABF54393.1 CBS domain containing membrane protein [Sphingopyxis alaskensis RB2256]MCM3417895.1 CBS domain-containing protein [Sphingopyxis alaskensis]
MKIAAIVSRKGREFETVDERSSLAEAVDVMHRKAIGSVGVATGRGAIISGLVSQQELTSAIALHGADALSRPVADFMRKPVLSCRCDDNAADVMHVMTRERCRHAVVWNAAGTIAGLVSLGDLVAALLEEARLEAGVLRDLARSRLLAMPG